MRKQKWEDPKTKCATRDLPYQSNPATFIENELTHVNNKIKHFWQTRQDTVQETNLPNNLAATHVVVPLQFPSRARYQARHVRNRGFEE